MKDNEKTILVVEDEKPLQEIIKTKLESGGYAVSSARSVEQAMDYLEQGMQIDVLWLDHYLLGKETGLDLVEKLKSDGAKWKSIPIFVVSNTASEGNVTRYLALGVEKYYTKSHMRLDDIVLDIEKFLDKELSSD